MFEEGKGIKKTRKILIILFVVLIAGPGLTYLVLRNSKVQTFVVQRVAVYLSKQLETNVEVGGLDITFFLNIVLKDVTIDDREGNPMVKTQRMVFDINRISFRNRSLSINKLYLEEAHLGLKRYSGDEAYNFTFLLDYFSNGDKSEERASIEWDVICKSLEFSNSYFSYNDANLEPITYGFDINHFEISDFKLVMNDIFVEDNALSFNLEHMAFNESRGFKLTYLSGWFSANSKQALVEKVLLRSSGSEVSMDVVLEYDGFESFSNFFEDVALEVTLHDSNIDLYDVGYYLPNAYGIQDKVAISGRFNGKPSDFEAIDFSLSYGMHTSFKGDFNLSGLPDTDNARLVFSIKEFNTSVSDIQGFRMPYSREMTHIVLPENISKLDRLSYQGSLSGSIDDLMVIGTLKTSLGTFITDLSVINNKSASLYSYAGHISTKEFALGRFVGNGNKLGSVSLDLEIDGEGLSIETMELALTGKVNSLYWTDYEYKNMDVTGNVSNRMFNGALLIDDQNISFEFLGVINFEEDMPIFDFQAKADNTNLTALNLYQRTEEAESIVSAQLKINARGGSLDQLEGQLEIFDLTYEEHFGDVEGEPKSVTYYTEHIGLVNTMLTENNKALFLTSDYIDASLIGEVYFESLGAALRDFVYLHIPAFRDNDDARQANAKIFAGNGIQRLDMEVHFKHTEVLSELFLPSIKLADNSTIDISFDSANQELDVDAQSEMLTLFGNRLRDWNLFGSMVEGGYQITNQSSRLLLTDSLFVENFCLDGLVSNDTLMYEAVWHTFNTEDTPPHGHIRGITHFIDKEQAVLRFFPSYAMVNQAKWQINIDNEVVFDSARVEILNLVIYNEEQLVNINGVLSADPIDKMQIYFYDFQFSSLDAMIPVKNMNFDGTVNGMVSFTTLFQPVSFEADLNVEKFTFNYEHLGDLTLQSEWVDPLNAFRVKVEISDPENPDEKSLTSSGFIHTGQRTDNFDLDIHLNEFPLSVWSRYLESFAQDFQGATTGKLRLSGPSNNPGLSGLVHANQAGFRIDYLKTRYAFSHQVRIEKNYFTFDNLMLVDSLGNTGLTTGTVWHERFNDFSMDIRIRPEQMVVLNTNAYDNELYYGRAFASGLLHIHGTEDDITMDISARTNRGTQIFLPLSYSGEVVENNFITFVTKDTTLTSIQAPEMNISGVTLNFDLDVTPDAEVQLIFDSQIGDVIRGRGSGTLRLEITPQGTFSMYGEYVIDEGDYLFTLQNLINKRFRVQQGGAIRWTGDPNDADIDLRAAYRLRTALYDLMMDVDTTDMYRRRVPVECILILKDQLVNPEISFDIHLPGGDEGTRELIERRITTEQEMNRQVFSLLVLNRFLPATTDQYNTALGYGVGSTSSELLSNQLSNWLSQISSEFDIGINYRPGDQISSQELEVALSTQLFDDRVIIDGNFGVAGSHASANQRTSNIIGDIIVEVKITPEGKFRVKAFNRSNTIDLINLNSPYTQGVGVFYRKEFDSIFDLLKRSSRSEDIPDVIE